MCSSALFYSSIWPNVSVTPELALGHHSYGKEMPHQLKKMDLGKTDTYTTFIFLYWNQCCNFPQFLLLAQLISLWKTPHLLKSLKHFEYQSCIFCQYCYVKSDNWHVTDDDSSHDLNLHHVRFWICISSGRKMLLYVTCRVQYYVL